MAANNLTGENVVLPIYNQDGTSFNGLVLKKSVYESIVMSLGDKITGDVYYPDNSLVVTMNEYVEYNGVRYVLVNPPTIVREGMVSDNGELKGMTKFSFTFYHPMYMLGNFPFCDVAVSADQRRYLSENKTFAWIGNLVDFVAKINKNLENTEWYCVISGNVQTADRNKLSEVESFDKNTIADALKRGYEIWEIPYIISTIESTDPLYSQGKRYLIQYGLPTTEILVENEQHELVPFVFHFGQGVGLKNNSRTPRNNKIVTRIAGYGSEENIQFGYPQIVWEGDQSWKYTINNDSSASNSYPIYDGIVNGQPVKLIKHPFTRTHLMPSIYRDTVNKKVNPMATGYDPDIEIKDYYDADNTYENPIKPEEPSYEIHEFEKVKPELGEKNIVNAFPFDEKETLADFVKYGKFMQDLKHRAEGTNVDIERHILFELYNKVASGTDWTYSGGDDSSYWYDIVLENDTYYSYVKYTSANINFTATVQRSQPVSPEWNDDMDGDGKYKQSYFKITLPQLDFDIYACAAVTQEMSINMRGGACIGCTFVVQVDWDDYKANFYDESGNFLPDGEQRDLDKYPDSRNGQITVIVQKDTDTFGTLMPNIYQKPQAGDKFVILGIALPLTYITNAETRLDADMLQYMRDNNVYYFDYPLKFDEKFLADHTGILNQMQNNVIVRFDYAGEVYALYIKQITIKYENNPLPTYNITLTDDIEIVLNQIGQVTEEVSKLRLMCGDVGGVVANGSYIRKDVDDTAYGFYRLTRGFQVGGRFSTGILGEGGVFRKDSDGTTYLETDKLYVRMRAYFDTVEVKRFLHSGGNRIASAADGINCSRIEYINASGNVVTDPSQAVLFRCYFKASENDKTITNDFAVGDQAFCKETNVDVSEVNQHGYWRLVVGRNANGVLTEAKEAWIDLSNRTTETITIGGTTYTHAGYQSGSDIPVAQDDISQLGNIHDTTRQGAIVEYVGGDDAPSYKIYQGIDDFTLNGKSQIELGYSSQSGHAYMNVYGDAYIGTPSGTPSAQETYIRYNSQTKKLDIKANINIESPVVDGQTTMTLQEIFSGLSELAEEAKDAADDAEEHASSFDYISAALENKTQVFGGLMLTSLMGLGQIDQNENFTMWSGINGIYSDLKYGGGVAAWYGGEMGDVEHQNQYPNVSRHPKTLFRMDGSGYVANGSISWDATGLTNANVSSISAATINLGGKSVATQEWVGQNYISISYFDRLFRAYNGDNLVNHNDTQSTIDNIKAMFSFWTDAYLAALGNSSGSGVSLTIANMGDVQLSTPTNGQALIYNATTQKWVNQTISATGNYLPLTGGTLTGDLFFEGYNNRVFGIKRTSASAQDVINNIDVGWDWANRDGAGAFFRSVEAGTLAGDFGFFARNANDSCELLGKPDGTLTWGRNPILTSANVKTVNGQSIYGTGNISVGGTGGDADTVDGYHASSLGIIYTYSIPASGCVRISFDNRFAAIISVRRTNESGGLILIGNGYGANRKRNTWTQLSPTTTFRWSVPASDSIDKAIEIQNGSGNAASVEVTMLNSAVPTFSSVSSLYSTGNNIPIATANSNVASATKLETSRSLWGQSFDGTADVSGAISNAGNITPSANASYNLGSSALWWNRIYTRYIDTASGYNLRLCAAGTERVTITTSGNVGIGTTSPNYKLHVNGTIGAGNITGANLDSEGYISALSDRRKKNIVEYMDGLTIEQIAKAPIIKFTWIDRPEDGLQVGSIAQYWEKVLPQSVHTTPKGFLSFAESRAALIGTISNSRELVKHEKRIAALEQENMELRMKLENVAKYGI